MNATLSRTVSNTSLVTAVDPALVSGLPIYINPAQMSQTTTSTALQPSSSSTTITIPIKKRSNPPLKRKRTDTPDSGEGCTAQSQQQQPARKSRDGPKKKKANRACFHCQKAHLTCDDSRPCQRCVKRGIPNCTEGHRKKAKYLLDETELEQLKNSKPPENAVTNQDNVCITVPEPTAPPAPTIPEAYPPPPEPMFTTPFDSSFPFGSEAANSEYSILSAILGTTVTPDSGTPPPSSQPLPFGGSPWTTEMLSPSQIFATSPRLGANAVYGSTFGDQSILSDTSLSSTVPPDFLSSAYSPLQSYQRRLSQSQADPAQLQQFAFKHPQPLQAQAGRFPTVLPRFSSQDVMNVMSSLVDGERSLISPPPTNPSPASSISGGPSVSAVFPEASTRGPSSPASHLQSINSRVTMPFDYTEGYHFLMKHLPTRFDKNDILRVVRALAIFRPSLIALQMPLTVEDETFAEKCFQRSILELEKLISFSGTPTVVWRRTGEICLVASEFYELTEWTPDELVGRKKYIYELFENQSVVEYWENFANHAFENTTTAVNTHCVLLKPSGAPIPCTFCFSIRRDLFDLPSIIIGQWLPLL